MTTINSNTGFVYIKQFSNTIYYSYNNVNWDNSITWPSTITSSSTVLFITDITLTSSNDYFICASNNIQFGSNQLNSNGTRPIITINNIIGYPGLIQNLNYGNINIFNLIVDGTTSTLASYGGWIAQQSFAQINKENYIINCKSIGDISINCGGIVGSLSVFNGAKLYIIGCISSGNINAGSGGIIGETSCIGSGSLLSIEQSFSSGNISFNGGGIFGKSCGINGGAVIARKCYSTGSIGQNAGGIFGNNAGSNGNITITNCYSTGSIGINAGGIFGTYAGSNSGSIEIQNCYSTGSIDIDAGGIFGRYYSNPGGNISILHCYTSGTGSIGGIFSGSSNDTLNGSNNYSEANNGNIGTWNNNNALRILQHIGSSSWISLIPNNPYIILNMGSTPYSITNINSSNYTLINNYINPSLIIQGQSTSSPIVSGYSTFKLLNNNESSITIHPSTGQIITSSTTPLGTYTFIIYANSDYTTSIYTFSVIPSLSISICNDNESTNIAPCCQPNIPRPNPQITNYNSNIIINKSSSKTINRSINDFYEGISTGQQTAYSQPIFKSYHDYILFLQGKLR
jgi:hypothetical protein